MATRDWGGNNDREHYAKCEGPRGRKVAAIHSIIAFQEETCIAGLTDEAVLRNKRNEMISTCSTTNITRDPSGRVWRGINFQ